jgi:hypothetical protein
MLRFGVRNDSGCGISVARSPLRRLKRKPTTNVRLYRVHVRARSRRGFSPRVTRYTNDNKVRVRRFVSLSLSGAFSDLRTCCVCCNRFRVEIQIVPSEARSTISRRTNAVRRVRRYVLSRFLEKYLIVAIFRFSLSIS